MIIKLVGLGIIVVLFYITFKESFKPQNKRIATMLSLNAGYVVDMSKTTYTHTETVLDVEHEEYSNSLMLNQFLLHS